jgi:hypothetical protein
MWVVILGRAISGMGGAGIMAISSIIILLDQVPAYLNIHPTANSKYESSNIGLRP